MGTGYDKWADEQEELKRKRDSLRSELSGRTEYGIIAEAEMSQKLEEIERKIDKK